MCQAISNHPNDSSVSVTTEYKSAPWINGHIVVMPLRRRHNGRDGVSDHQPRDCLLNNLFGRRSKKTSKLRVTGLCAGNSPGTGEFPAQMASNAENVSIWWRPHAMLDRGQQFVSFYFIDGFISVFLKLRVTNFLRCSVMQIMKYVQAKGFEGKKNTSFIKHYE